MCEQKPWCSLHPMNSSAEGMKETNRTVNSCRPLIPLSTSVPNSHGLMKRQIRISAAVATCVVAKKLDTSPEHVPALSQRSSGRFDGDRREYRDACRLYPC